MRKFVFNLILFILTGFTLAAQMKYPHSRKQDQTDVYFGKTVTDPYRWLEDDRSEETHDWVLEQNKVTNAYLDKIPNRSAWLTRLEQLNDYPKYSTPFRNNGQIYYYKNSGLQNQSLLYRQREGSGKEELVIDPNQFSSGGTTSLALFQLSKNGKYAVVGKSSGGSDWRTFLVMDMQTGSYLSDSLAWVKVSGAAWQGDGFYYSRYPAPEKGSELSAKNENHQVYFHRIGDAQEKDQLVFEDKAHPQRFHQVFTSEDEAYVMLTVTDRGKGKKGNAVWYRTAAGGPFKPIIAEAGEYNYNFVAEFEGRFIFSTNDAAKNQRVISIDPNQPSPANWKTLIKEESENISFITSAGSRIFVSYLKDVCSKVYVYRMDGKKIDEVEMPGLGTVSGFGGKKEDQKIFYSYTSFTSPPTVYTYDLANGKSKLFREPKLLFYPSDYQTDQEFFTATDGVKVPMFIIYKKGMKRNRKNPTILYGYGGFNVSLNPSFSAARLAWLEKGGVYVMVNLRGGSEYGEKWHEAGMLGNKQQVFNDFIGAAEWLIKKKITSANYLACQGGSNGGLLVGAVINQRPDLFRVAIPQVGVMDMLRFHKFTIGWNWIPEYGSSENEKDFPNLYGYSPLHNIREGINYPSTLITTADHDDRVVPAHSFKYAATLQEKYKGKNPLLIRIDVNSGHGSSNLRKGLELMADIFAFAWSEMGD